jgi:hypothetical protein
VLTAVVAVYGAVVATLSLALTGWIFMSSGPKVQAEASLARPSITPTGRWHVYLQVWNTGRQDIKIEFRPLILDHHTGRVYALRLNWEGPEVPMMLPAHSGDHWFGRAPDSGNDEILAVYNDYLGVDSPPAQPPKLRVLIQVGGRRVISVPVVEQRWTTTPRSRLRSFPGCEQARPFPLRCYSG